MGINKAPGDVCSIKFVQIAEWKISEELAPVGCFANGKQFSGNLGLHIHICQCIHTLTKLITGKLGILLQAIAEILEIQMKPLFHPQPLHTLAGTHHL